MKRLAVVIAAVLAMGGLTSCSSPFCPSPVKQANGTYTIDKMSRSCEKRLYNYDKHHHSTTTKRTTSHH